MITLPVAQTEPKTQKLDARRARLIALALLKSYAGRTEFELGPLGSFDVERIFAAFADLGCAVDRAPGAGHGTIRCKGLCFFRIPEPFPGRRRGRATLA